MSAQPSMPRGGVQADMEREARLVELYKTKTLRQIGALEGISYERVRQILDRAGTRMRPGIRGSAAAHTGAARGTQAPRVRSQHRNGRAARVREYLGTQAEPKTAREILDAVEPDGDISNMCATLSNLQSGHHVARVGTGYGARWTLSASAKTAGKPPAAPPSRAVTRGMAPAPTAEPVTSRGRGLGRAVSGPEQRTNFHAAPGTVSSVAIGKATASDQIARDIAAFEARGGAIERLGVTGLFHHIDVDTDE